MILLIMSFLILTDNFNISYNTGKRYCQGQTLFYRVLKEFKVIFRVSKFRFLNTRLFKVFKVFKVL